MHGRFVGQVWWRLGVQCNRTLESCVHLTELDESRPHPRALSLRSTSKIYEICYQNLVQSMEEEVPTKEDGHGLVVPGQVALQV